MDKGTVHQLHVPGRHLAVDERGIGLRATWHVERGFVNLSLWRNDRCVETFHLTPVEAGRLIGFLVSRLADAVPDPADASLAAVPPSAPGQPSPPSTAVKRLSGSLGSLRHDLAGALDRAANRLRP